MFLRLITLFSLFKLSSSVIAFKYSSCGISSDIAQNIELSVTPELPQDKYTLYLNADVSKEVTGGTSKYTITYNFLPLSPTINDLCTEISNSNISCPLINHISSESQGEIPTGLSGTTIIKNEWFDLNNNRILCMNFNIKT